MLLKITPLSIRQMKFQINAYGKNTGNSDQLTVSTHAFRRTFAKNKVQTGVDLFTLQTLLGHIDLDTLKNYLYELLDRVC